MAGKTEDMECSETSTSSVPAAKKARIVDIFRQRNAEDEASGEPRANRFGHSSGLGPNVLFSDNKNSSSKDKGPKYDLDNLMSKRIIRSEAVSKTRLINRDAKLVESIGKKSVEEEDEIFFENVKKRMDEDRRKNIVETTKPLPKRSPKLKKRKPLFDDESLNLMKKFRAEFANRSDRMAVEKNGAFSMEHRSVSQNQENINVNQMATKNSGNMMILDNKMSKNVVYVDKFGADGASLCATPKQVDASAYNRHPTPSSSDTAHFGKSDSTKYF